MAPVIECRGLFKTFGEGSGAVSALNGIDIAIERGDFVAIMGPSGCGKSTLLNILAGLDRPTSGEVLLEGKRIDSLSETKLAKMRRTKIGFVFQSFNLIPTLTAGENVELPLRLAGKRRRVARKTAHRFLTDLGVAHRRDASPALLSGGEQQRVALARAMANEPDVISPTSRPGVSILKILETCSACCAWPMGAVKPS